MSRQSKGTAAHGREWQCRAKQRRGEALSDSAKQRRRLAKLSGAGPRCAKAWHSHAARSKGMATQGKAEKSVAKAQHSDDALGKGGALNGPA